MLLKADVPYAVEAVHNAGVAKNDGKYILWVVRNDGGFHLTADPEPSKTHATGIGVTAFPRAFSSKDAGARLHG